MPKKYALYDNGVYTGEVQAQSDEEALECAEFTNDPKTLTMFELLPNGEKRQVK